MNIGNVIIIDGKVGTISETYSKVIRKEDLTCKFEVTMLQGVYLTGEQFNIPVDKSVILLDDNLNKYIDRLVRKFGKVRISSRGRND